MYRFFADSMFIFVVTLPSGLIKNVEFDSAGQGVYSYLTDSKDVADCIRRHPLTRKGRIVDKSDPEDGNKLPEAGQITAKAIAESIVAKAKEKAADKDVLHFDNITMARDYLVKNFGVSRSLKKPESILAKAEELGVKIQF